MQRAGGMEHVTACLERHGLFRIEGAAGSREPGALDDSDVTIMRMPVRPVHDMRRKSHALHIEPVAGRISSNRRQLRAMTIGQVLPPDLLGCQADEVRAGCQLRARRAAGYDRAGEARRERRDPSCAHSD